MRIYPLIAAMIAFSPQAFAEPFDSRSSTVHVGADSNYCSHERAGSSASASPYAFPGSLGVVARANGSVLERAPLVDRDGNTFVFTNAEVLVYDRALKVRARARVPGEAGPVVLRDGTVLLPGAPGEIGFVSSSGRVRWISGIVTRARELPAMGLPLEDGGAAFVTNRSVWQTTSTGHVHAKAELLERAVRLFSLGDDTFLLMESGELLSFRPPTLPKHVASLGSTVFASGAIVSGDSLFAVSDAGDLMRVRLSSGRIETFLGGQRFEGTLAPLPGGGVWAALLSGHLAAFDVSRNELNRAQFDIATLPPAARATPGKQRGVVLLSNRYGQVAFIAGNGRVGVAERDGRVAFAGGDVCPSPFALAPHPGGLLVACRDGTIVVLGNAN